MGNIVKAIVYGQEYNLVYNSSTGKYEAEVTAPIASSYQNNAGHYFPVSIIATDEAGNSTTVSDTVGNFRENLKLYVKEQIKPKVIDITPSSGANITTSNPTFEFTVVDNANGQNTGFAGINPDSIVLIIGGNTVNTSDITKTPITGGYKCTYTPSTAIADGECTFSIKVSDYDGNDSETIVTVFKVDTVPPVLEITSPADGSYYNTGDIIVIGKTSDATSSPVTVSIAVNGTDQGSVTVGSDGSFSKEITLDNVGDNTITIIATDMAGKKSTITRTVVLKTTAPEFKTVEIAPNPINCGKTYTISVSFVED